MSPGTVLPLVWYSLLMATPQVLALPSPFGCDGLSLAFSALVPALSLAGLAGSAMGDARAGKGARRGIVRAGLVASTIYLVASWWTLAMASWRTAGHAPTMGISLAIGVVASVCGAFGMFACCSLVARRHVDGVRSDRCRLLALLSCALFVPAMLGFVARILPNWTLVRVSASAAGADGKLLAEALSLGTFGGAPGAQPLDAGLFAPAFFTAAGCVVWAAASVAAGLLASRIGRFPIEVALRGYCSGYFLTWVACSVFPALARVLIWNAAVPGALAALAVALCGVALAFGRKGERGRGDDAVRNMAVSFDGSGLSPRESQAVALRLEGLSSSEAARRMGVSASTVRNLQSRAAGKLGTPLDELADTPSVPSIDDASVSGDLPGYLRSILLAALLGIVLLGFSAGGSWSCECTRTMILGLCLVFYGFAWRPVGKVAATWHSSLACLFVGWLLGLNSLLAVACALLALGCVLAGAASGACALGVRGRGALAPAGLGMALGGYSAGLAPRLPALLALAASGEGAMACALTMGLVSGAFLVAGITSCVGAASRALGVELGANEANAKGRPRDVVSYLASRGLSATQVEVALLLAKGQSGPDVCAGLHLSLGAVNSARRAIYQKLGVHSRGELAALIDEATGQ